VLVVDTDLTQNARGNAGQYGRRAYAIRVAQPGHGPSARFFAGFDEKLAGGWGRPRATSAAPGYLLLAHASNERGDAPALRSRLGVPSKAARDVRRQSPGRGGPRPG